MWTPLQPTKFTPTPERPYQHKEAFCLMIYASDDGSIKELLWNSRDGVTPFCISARHDPTIMMRHIRWNEDRCLPDYEPPPGSRIFVDATLQLVKPELEKYIDRIWPQGASETFGTKDSAFKRLLDSWLQEGAPWIVEAS